MADYYKVEIDGEEIINFKENSTTSDNVLSGYTFHNNKGVQTSGSIANYGNVTVNISDTTEGGTTNTGYYKTVTVDCSEGVKAENIKNGVSILGVTGTSYGGYNLSQYASGSFQTSSNSLSVTASIGFEPKIILINIQASSKYEVDSGYCILDLYHINPTYTSTMTEVPSLCEEYNEGILLYTVGCSEGSYAYCTTNYREVVITTSSTGFTISSTDAYFTKSKSYYYYVLG